MTKPLILYIHGPSPNPRKVAVILEELGIPYETKLPGDFKAEPFISFNPNGRMPALIDPNTDITLFESGAIIEYLVDKYDTDKKLQYTTDKEKYLTKSWLYFQMSGQGPYFGQLAWFKLFHDQKIPSAVERYEKEMKRVTGVIDAHLKKQKTPYLVGDKITYADLSFVTWCNVIHGMVSPDWDYKTEYPTYAEWLDKLTSRDSVKKVVAMEQFQSH